MEINDKSNLEFEELLKIHPEIDKCILLNHNSLFF